MVYNNVILAYHGSNILIVMPQVSVPGSAAVTSFDDMISMVLTHEDDPEVLKWVASSFFCASTSGKN